MHEHILEIEAWLHSLGYRYTGPGSLYDMTFAEIANLSEGQRLLSLTSDGVTAGEEDMLNELAERLG